MKKLILSISFALLSNLAISQSYKGLEKISQPWALSTSLGYINVSGPINELKYQSNTWASLNLSYSTNKWTFGAWTGANYWINGKQPDFRIGITTTYTIKKW